MNADGDGATLVHVNTGTTARDLTIDLSKFGAIAPGATVTPDHHDRVAGRRPHRERARRGHTGACGRRRRRSASSPVPAKSVTTLVISGVSGVSDRCAGRPRRAPLPARSASQSDRAPGGRSLVGRDPHAARRRRMPPPRRPGRCTRSPARAPTVTASPCRPATDGSSESRAAGRPCRRPRSEAASTDPTLQWIATTSDGTDLLVPERRRRARARRQRAEHRRRRERGAVDLERRREPAVAARRHGDRAGARPSAPRPRPEWLPSFRRR